MTAHDSEIKELEQSLERHRTKQKAKDQKLSKRKRRNGRTKYLGHKTNRGFYGVIIILLIIIGVLIYLHLSVVSEFELRMGQALNALEIAEARADKYQEAYEIVLEDAKAFSDFYAVNYTGAPELPEEAEVITLDGVAEISSTEAWTARIGSGIIAEECIPTTKLVQTPTKRVTITLTMSGEKAQEWPRVQIFIDGTRIGDFDVESEEANDYAFTVALERGYHYLDFIYPNGNRADSLTIHEISVGDRVLETKLNVIDEGALLAMFDCEDTHKGTTLTTIGAMRLKLEKQ